MKACLEAGLLARGPEMGRETPILVLSSGLVEGRVRGQQRDYVGGGRGGGGWSRVPREQDSYLEHKVG